MNFHLYSFFSFNFREFSTVEAKENKKFRPPESVKMRRLNEEENMTPTV